MQLRGMPFHGYHQHWWSRLLLLILFLLVKCLLRPSFTVLSKIHFCQLVDPLIILDGS